MLIRPTLYPIAAPAPARLSIMPRPRGGLWLDDEMVALRRSGADLLVCLQTAAELKDLELTEEPESAAAAGLEFQLFPIVDLGVPDHGEVQPLLDTLAARLTAGQHVVVHCRAGIGRSSLIAAVLLIRLGVPVDRAWRVISEARGCEVPETEGQRRWLDDARTAG